MVAHSVVIIFDDPIVFSPKKTPLSKKPRQSLSEEKPSAKDSLHKDGPKPYENVRKSVRDFCDWADSIVR